ncbi:MAG: branched-chain amino acid ABC transporter permease [Candidatus Bathyarchaeia archaeon]
MVEVGAVVIGNGIISGIVLGTLFSLMALGLTLIFATVRILNFAHGMFFTLGEFVVWWLVAPRFTEFGGFEPYASGLLLPFGIAFALGLGALFVVGVGTERLLIRPLRKKPGWEMTTLVATIALATVIESGTLLGFGYKTKKFDPIVEGVLNIVPGVTITNTEIAQFVIAIGVLIALQAFLRRNRQGLAMRAVSQDTEMGTLLGVRVNTTYLYAFAISAVLAALAGILLSNVLLIDSTVGTVPMLKAFIIIIFGGIGSVTGTLYAAFILGFIESFTALFIGLAWALPVEFAVMVIVLAIRPQGLFGFKE